MEPLEFECSDRDVWRTQLQSYESLLRALSLAKGKPKLPELDRFYSCSLPSLISSRRPFPFITSHELAQVMEWKLSRGKWRPRLLDFVKGLDDDEVKNVSGEALSLLPTSLETAISCLSKLKGVGPATASAILAIACPEVAPFMSDEAMIAVLGSSKDYSLKQYMVFAERLQHKAKELGDLTPSDLERALWCSVMEKMLNNRKKSTGDSSISQARKKRQRNS